LHKEEPYDPQYPTVCLDEKPVVLHADVHPPIPVEPGQPERVDYEYERKGTRNLFVMIEPLAGWRHVEVTAQRTMQDYAKVVRWLVDEVYPHAEYVRLVQDNLNTPTPAALYETFPLAQARRILQRVEFHYTPKHGSWLNMTDHSCPKGGPTISMKLFQTGWNGELQEPGGLTALNQEAVSDLLGQKNESACLSMPATFSADEREFPFEDIERLVFGVMHVQGRRKTWRQDLFNQAEGLSIVLSGRFEKHERTEKPDGLAFLAGEEVGFIPWRHRFVLLVIQHVARPRCIHRIQK
jgi:hypothetical protein